MTGPRVVIVGAGVVGAALADELTARGWDDVTVVDQGDLPAPGGSTSHAPGLVFQASGSKTMTELARYTVEKLGGLEVDGEPCFLQVGGLEVATTPERLAETPPPARLAHRLGRRGAPAGRRRDAPRSTRCWTPSVVLGGLWVPTDGLAKAVRAVEAQTRAGRLERAPGCCARHEVLDITVTDGRVTGVVTDQGELPADVVVCCAGIWGPVIARHGRHDPAAHPAGAPAGLDRPRAGARGSRPRRRSGRSCATRTPDLYYRERFDTLGIGYYGHRPMPIRADDIARPWTRPR